MFKKLMLLLLVPFSFSVNAIQIDGMLKIVGSDGKTQFTISNQEEKRIFVNVGINELEVVDKEIVSTQYTRENISDWKIEARPARTIIDPGFEKDFSVSLLCGESCQQEGDQIFKLAFVPTPYISESGSPEQVVQVAVGFAPIVINPGPDKPIDVRGTYIDEQVILENNGDSYVTAKISSCVEGEETNSCTKISTILAGRKLNINIPKEMQQSEFLDVSLSTNSNEYKESFRIMKKL